MRSEREAAQHAGALWDLAKSARREEEVDSHHEPYCEKAGGGVFGSNLDFGVDYPRRAPSRPGVARSSARSTAPRLLGQCPVAELLNLTPELSSEPCRISEPRQPGSDPKVYSNCHALDFDATRPIVMHR